MAPSAAFWRWRKWNNKKCECVYKSWCTRHSENDFRLNWRFGASEPKIKQKRIESRWHPIDNAVLLPDSTDTSATLLAALFANNDYFANQKWDLVGIYRYSQKVVILAQTLWSSPTKTTALFRAWRPMGAVFWCVCVVLGANRARIWSSRCPAAHCVQWSWQ